MNRALSLAEMAFLLTALNGPSKMALVDGSAARLAEDNRVGETGDPVADVGMMVGVMT